MVVRLVVRAVVFRVNIPVVVRLVVAAPAVVFRVNTLAVGVRALGRRRVTAGVMAGVRPVRVGPVRATMKKVYIHPDAPRPGNYTPGLFF